MARKLGPTTGELGTGSWKSYSYSGIHMNPKPWTQNLIQIKKAIEPIAKVTFNSVLINYYRDGKDRVAWHSDDEKELGQNPVIGSISLEQKENSKCATGNTKPMV